MSRKLSAAETKLLRFLQQQPEKEFHLNEFIRETGLLPRSVSLAVNQLQKRDLIDEKRIGNLRLIRLNKLNTVKYSVEVTNFKETSPIVWQKILNRKTWIGFQVELNEGCKEYFGKMLQQPNNKKLYQYNWYNSITESVYVVMDEFLLHGRIIGENLSSPKYAESIIKDCYNSAQKLLDYSKGINSNYATKIDNEQLVNILHEFQVRYKRLMPHLVLGTSIEYGLLELLKKALDDEQLVKELISPIYTTWDEYSDSLNIIKSIKNKKPFEEIIAFISEHTNKYAYLSMQSPADTPLTLNNFVDSIISLYQKLGNKSLNKIAVDVQKEKTTKLEAKLNQLKLTSHIKQIVWLLQKYMFLRTYRINIIYQSHLFIRPLLICIADRFRIEKDNIFLLSIDEITRLLKNPILLRKYLNMINQRKKGWAVLMWKGKVSIISGSDNVLVAIEKYNIKRKSLDELKGKKIIVGSPAFHGKVTGIARVIKSLSDMNTFKEGEILVTTMTTPDFTPVMAKAKAFVTDEGGITCHAAIVAREMKIPCIVGTRVATQIIKTGQFIEVNAVSGRVIILEDSDNIEITENTMQGLSAYPGVIKAKIKILHNPNVEQPIGSGYILVLKSAEPAFLPFVYKAKALILEEDSFTSHGNFYANALNIPTILGVKGATILLNDNMEVILDATRGQIKIVNN